MTVSSSMREQHERVIGRSTQRHQAQARKRFVGDSDMTAEQLVQRQRDLKADFLRREAARAGS